MIEHRCETCKYAEKEFVEGVGPGIRGYWGICGCKYEGRQPDEFYTQLEENGISADDWDNGEVGETIECPFHEEEEPDDY